MILVFLFIICVFFSMISLSKIELNIKNFNLQSFDKDKNNKELEILIVLKIFKFNWLKIRINKNKFSNIYIKQKIRMKSKNTKISDEILKVLKNIKKNRNIKKEIQKINFKLKSLNLKLFIGTEEANVSAYLVGSISAVISNLLPFITYPNKENNYYYKIEPIYINQNIYKITLNCIFDAKLVHIIYVIFKLLREDKNERTSNRKSYEYSYE